MTGNEKPDRSPSETLIDCMEAFGESEPCHVIVIWPTEDGFVNWSRNAKLTLSEFVGLLECVKAKAIQQWISPC